MAFVPSPECVKVALNFLTLIDTWSLVFHARTPAAVLPSDCAALAGIFKAWAANHLMPLLSSQASLEEVVATDQTSLTGSVFHDTGGLPAIGGIVQVALPMNVTMVVTQGTALRGRSYRGRSFLSSLPITAQDGPSHFLPASVSAVQTVYDLLAPAVTAGGYLLAILSTRNGGAPRAAGVTTPVISMRANVKVASQRRRLEN